MGNALLDFGADRSLDVRDARCALAGDRRRERHLRYVEKMARIARQILAGTRCVGGVDIGAKYRFFIVSSMASRPLPTTGIAALQALTAARTRSRTATLTYNFGAAAFLAHLCSDTTGTVLIFLPAIVSGATIAALLGHGDQSRSLAGEGHLLGGVLADGVAGKTIMLPAPNLNTPLGYADDQDCARNKAGEGAARAWRLAGNPAIGTDLDVIMGRGCQGEDLSLADAGSAVRLAAARAEGDQLLCRLGFNMRQAPSRRESAAWDRAAALTRNAAEDGGFAPRPDKRLQPSSRSCSEWAGALQTAFGTVDRSVGLPGQPGGTRPTRRSRSPVGCGWSVNEGDRQQTL